VALARKANGEYVLKSRQELVRALRMMQGLKLEIAQWKKENGIDEMEQDAVELKKAAERYMTSKGLDEIQLEGTSYAKLIRAGYDRRWILLDKDMPDEAHPSAMSLRRILKRHFSTDEFKAVWARVSKRVADPEGIQEVVDEGLITENEIAPAFIEKERRPFLRIYGERE